MKNKLCNFLKGIGQLALVFLVGYLVIRVAAFLTGEKSQQEIIREVIKEVAIKRPICPDTFESFVNVKERGFIELIKDFNSYGLNRSFVNEETVTLKVSGSGSQIACGYLYAVVRSGSKPIQAQENLYIKPDQFGGHIDSDSAILRRDSATSTALLFNLSKIFYKEDSQSKEIRKADWAALFNVSDKTTFRIALNTINPAGNIDEIIIAYKCWNPETGQETQDCQISVPK